MASTKIQNLPLKAPIGAMKIPTGGFGDYSITVSSIGDFIIDTFNLATKDYVDTLLLEKEDIISTTGGFLTPVSQNSSVPDTTNDVIDEVAQALLDRIEYVKDIFGNRPLHNELDGRSATNAHPSSSISHKSGTVYTYLQQNESDINTIKNVSIPLINQSLLTKENLIETNGTVSSTSTFSSVPSTNNSTINNSLQALVNRDEFLNVQFKKGITPTFDQTFSDQIGGYPTNSRIMLTNGDIVKSLIDENNVDPNVDMTNWYYDNLIHDRTYGLVLGSPVKFKLNPIKASFLYGISDPTHLDDDLNNFRGINNPDAYHDSNVAIGAVSFGRNNPPFAYLSLAGGHDCVPFGVASFVLGAGSCTGNPDDPVASANGVYGYCSLAVGKNTQARGRISNAMGERCLSESRYSSTDGYKCIAGKTQPTHPNYDLYGDDGAEGAASRAHGYVSQAYGNFAFAYGSMLAAYNGAQVIGKGINEGSPLIISKRGLGLGYNVDVPTIFCQAGAGVNDAQAQIGFNTDDPISKYDFRFKNSEVTSYVIDNLGFGAASFDVVGLLSGDSYGSLYKVVTTHPNAGQPYGTTTFWQNNIKVMSMDEVGNLAISPKAIANPTNNGDLVFELTSDTQLKVKVKGSDGIVRSATLTLT